MGQTRVLSHKSVTHFVLVRTILVSVNLLSHAWNTDFSKFDLEYSNQKLWERLQFKAIMCVALPIDSHSFHSMSGGPPVPVMRFFQHLTLKIQCEGHKPIMLHNYRFRQFHNISNGVNPSSEFTYMGSTKSWLGKLLTHGKEHMGLMGTLL